MPTTASQPNPGGPIWVALAPAAERVSLCERTLRRAMANGELTGYRFGKALRVKLSELDAWAESKAMPNARTTGTGRRR
ncbi:helix-turn-helix domain-containing protein [Tessaracoccus sp. Z1128]